MTELPIPPHFNRDKVGKVWRVPYQERAAEAEAWKAEHAITPAAKDAQKICLLLVDMQNTFCIPGFELFVAGRSGDGAVQDVRRLCEFLYRNLGVISDICPTLDTHRAVQIFHSIFFVNEEGQHPAPATLISLDDIENEKWRFNRELSRSLGISDEYAAHHLRHYTQALRVGGKYDLTIWPYHAMLGGIGHALVSAVEEAIFFHSIARSSQPDFQQKGEHPLTENYSVLSPEVTRDFEGKSIGAKNDAFHKKLLSYDAIVVAGQAKSHCVAWTVEDLLQSLKKSHPDRTKRVYLLEDCTSPVVIPDVIDYTDAAEEAFERYAAAGMHIVHSTTPMKEWPDLGI